MSEPMRSRRRIEHLKQLAYDCNLTNEQARTFGKLSATATYPATIAAQIRVHDAAVIAMTFAARRRVVAG